MRSGHVTSGVLSLVVLLSWLATPEAQTVPAAGTQQPGATPIDPQQPAGTPATQPEQGVDPSALPAQGARSDAIRALNERFEEKRMAINEEYAGQIASLQEQYMTELAGLATKGQGAEAEAAYRQLFAYAIATEQYEPAAIPARDYLAADAAGQSDLRDLARAVSIGAYIEIGEFGLALQELREYLEQGLGDQARSQAASRRLVALGENLIRRLLEARNYDLARQVPALFLDRGLDPAIEAHFRARQTQLGLIDQPAPAIELTDVDGQPFRLADLRGQVVLVSFWAAWCPPCLAEIPRQADLLAKHRDQGFELVGVNLDAAREGISGPQEALQAARQVLIDYGVTWPNVVAETGPKSVSQAYGITSIPSNVLIGRDGTVLAIDVPADRLDEAITTALAPPQQPAQEQ